MPKARMMPSILLCATLALPGCVGGPVLKTTPSACASLIPDEWWTGVGSAALPEGDVVSDWIAFADAQTARIDKADGRMRDVQGILQRCEARDAKALAQSRAKFLGVF